MPIPPDPPDRILAWRQLLRVGNVFTAASNIAAGFLLVQRGWAPADQLAWLAIASMLIYLAGMALNDAYDAEIDAEERPERPIPSGRIDRRSAFAAGWLLLGGGVTAALGAAWASRTVAPAVVAGCLALTVVMYDGGLKRTWAGPWAMGWCRLLNVLLGASVAANLAEEPAAWKFALAVGAYTVGLSYLARDEATDVSPARARNAFFAAAVCFVAALVGLLAIVNEYRLAVPRYAWGTLLIVVFGAIAVAWTHAQRGPRERVAAIVGLLRGFIVLDALAALAAAGWAAAACVLLLLAPTLIAARRAPMT
ncbi:MAG: UbiA family prenyltransferase [Planctomycetales bacterium]|nr:UbiA family prenyltransferase [Planctomycetales bacterium]